MFQPELETISRDELHHLQNERLQKTVTRVYEHVPFYRKQLDKMGIHPKDFAGIDELSQLPFTVKKDLRDYYPRGLFAAPPHEIVRLHASSGTKGKPTVVGYTRQDLNHWADVCARSIVAAGGTPGDTFHNAYGYGLFTGGLGIHAGGEKLGVSVVPASAGSRMRHITLIEDLKPRGIAGTPTFLLSIGETMRQNGKDPKKSSLEYGIFGAEPWTEEMRRELEEMWGIQAVDIYGLSEVMGPGVAIECWEEKQGLHIFEDHFLVEVIHPDTGRPVEENETGELVFTSLTKEALPLLRYRTGDLASLSTKPCRCGRTHVRMSRVKGRIDDMLIIRGVNVFPMEIEPVVLEHQELAPHYQIVIEKKGSLDELTVEVELADTCQGVDLEGLNRHLRRKLKDVLQISVQVQIGTPGTIPRSQGKAVRIIDKRTN
ncbi:phenylacetate--CoA ligase family protein [Thermoactinomyces mirandus]|uniref:Phenylacetate-coenzyme A ligase n=1 Tax=Thermoactinomyces mirandus TaxID=2756294 RepID=A0A7W1XRW1_9BACL|nr:phenylacetate--CoA ligase [Thermoactinomyces mirandus]MBA4601900.1 phenylacetate--CoA ligase [Thermoactinomyces mirandus]